MKMLLITFLIAMTTPTKDIEIIIDTCTPTNTFTDHSLVGVTPLDAELCYVI